MEPVLVMIYDFHLVKSVCIRSYSGPYSVQIRENADQNKSEYGRFLQIVKYFVWRLYLQW